MTRRRRAVGAILAPAFVILAQPASSQARAEWMACGGGCAQAFAADQVTSGFAGALPQEVRREVHLGLVLLSHGLMTALAAEVGR